MLLNFVLITRFFLKLSIFYLYFYKYIINNDMKIVNVIPIAKGVFKEKLSYFTAKNAPVGAMVTVPVRGKNIPAIVVASEDAKKAKSEIKSSGFQMKAVSSVKSSLSVRPEFIDACKEIADYFVSSTGAVLKDFLPQAILENEAYLDSPGANEQRLATASGRREIALIQSTKKERLQYYRSVIREEFAKNCSVFFCLPTMSGVDYFSEELQKGIEKYAVVYHGGMTKKKVRDAWRKTLGEEHPLLIVATKSFLSVPRKDISVIIVDRENSSAYKVQKRPYVDIRKSAEIISEKLKTKLIFGDSVIRSETFHKWGGGESRSPLLSHSRILSGAEQIIVDMKEGSLSERQNGLKRSFVISQKLQTILEKTSQNNERTILFVNRRGYGSTTVCADCQRVILCGKCDAPLVLHKNNLGNGVVDSARGKKFFFVCHKCLSEEPTPEQCPYCKGWRIETFGIGVQKVVDEVARLFPQIKIFKMDSDAVTKDAQASEINDAFFAASGAVLIGTEFLFSRVNQPVENVTVVSIDGLFAIPDFRINEKIFQLLLKLRSLAQKTFLIQTRLPEQSVFRNAIKGNVSGFYKEEIENRKRFGYPPFKLFIKLTKNDRSEASVVKETEETEKILAEWKPLNYKAFIPKIKNMHSRHILLKIDPLEWPGGQEKLRNILSSLAPAWKIEVDPESLL